MPSFLEYQFEDTPGFVDTFDEAPLWSAAFGLLLLKHLPLTRGIRVADIGSGTGFPLLELAQRLGNTSHCYGIDTWVNANSRARRKMASYGIANVEILDSPAERMPLPDNSLDMVVSNLGIHNFSDPQAVIHECHRVLKPGGILAITTNFYGHWKEFYGIFRDTLLKEGREDLASALLDEEMRRGSVSAINDLFSRSGFKTERHFEELLQMQFADGTAFLNHSFVKLGWLDSWRKIVPLEMQERVFTMLEKNLNEFTFWQGCLDLSVPMLYIEGRKE